MFWTAFWIIHSCIYWIVVVDFFLLIEKVLFQQPVKTLFKQKTIDVLCLLWLIPELFVVGFFGKIWFGFFTVWVIFRLARDNYDDDDDTHGKRLLSWGKSKLPKPYVKPIPVPV